MYQNAIRQQVFSMVHYENTLNLPFLITVGANRGLIRGSQGGVLYLVFCPRTRPKTFLQCFALDSRCTKAKLCRDVLGCILGQKTKYKTPPLMREYCKEDI